MPDHEKCEYARGLERDGREQEAEVIYQHLLAEDFEGNFPYDRLAIIYRKRKDYDKEIKTLKQAIDVFDRLSRTSSRDDVPKKLEKFKARLEKARIKQSRG